MSETHDIDKLVKATVPVVKGVGIIVDATHPESAGGKEVVFTEWIKLAPNGIAFVMAMMHVKEIIDEVRDLDPLEFEAYCKAIAENLDIEYEMAEKAVKKLMGILPKFGYPVEELIDWWNFFVKNRTSTVTPPE